MVKDQMNDDIFNAQVNCVQNNGSKKFTRKSVEGVNLVYGHGKIYVPREAQARVLEWYHRILVHSGKHRMYKTMNAIFTWENVNKDVKKYCKQYHECQIAKLTNKKKYNLLPEK